VEWDTSPLAQIGASQALYGTALPPGMPVGPDEAWRATTLYLDSYHYAYPFPRAIIEDFWRRCRQNPARRGECQEWQARAEELLGKLAD
jgi:hypothetical protein